MGRPQDRPLEARANRRPQRSGGPELRDGFGGAADREERAFARAGKSVPHDGFGGDGTGPGHAPDEPDKGCGLL